MELSIRLVKKKIYVQEFCVNALKFFVDEPGRDIWDNVMTKFLNVDEQERFWKAGNQKTAELHINEKNLCYGKFSNWHMEPPKAMVKIINAYPRIMEHVFAVSFTNRIISGNTIPDIFRRMMKQIPELRKSWEWYVKIYPKNHYPSLFEYDHSPADNFSFQPTQKKLKLESE